MITLVDRRTRCFLGVTVVPERTQEVIQGMVDRANKAQWYYSDAFDAYERLYYHGGRYVVSVEGSNAELRHYLARRSRCFSRCPKALSCAIQIFVSCFNQRQLFKQRFPHYPASLLQFV